MMELCSDIVAHLEKIKPKSFLKIQHKVPQQLELKQFQALKEIKRPHTCILIDPRQTHGRYVTNSLNMSVFALITCAKYNIPLESILKSWWTMIGIGRDAYARAVKQNYSPAFRIEEVWNRIQETTPYCLKQGATNFLYEIYMRGQCQCSCGTVALREIMNQIDPTIKTWYQTFPAHVMLAVQDSPDQVSYIETATLNKLKVRKTESLKSFEDTYDTPELIEIFNLGEWIRAIFEEEEKYDINSESFLKGFEQLRLMAQLIENSDIANDDNYLKEHLGFATLITAMKYIQTATKGRINAQRQLKKVYIELVNRVVKYPHITTTYFVLKGIHQHIEKNYKLDVILPPPPKQKECIVM